MQQRRQFSGARKPRTFFDRKVTAVGYTRQISLGKVIPKDWRYVRIELLSRNDTDAVIKIHKLLGADINAQTEKADKADQQHT
jgi:hypothetical protein